MQKLLLGQLPVDEVERLAVEYADDVRLAELAESLSGKDDTLLNSLRTLDTVADPGDERLTERLLERLQIAQAVQPPHLAHPRDEAADPQLGETPSGASSPPAVSSVPTLPARLEHYRPIRVLGQGGMGTVYLVEDTRLGRECAVKTLRPELAVNCQARERFLHEAHTAATLEHDHIVPIHYVGEADGVPFLAMPLLKGETLDALLRRTAGPLPAREAIRIAREAASGLAAAHKHGLIHRDIKPTNIWLEAPRGRVRILDFGLAKAAGPGSESEADPHLTATGAIVGTPAYMAPEQASGHPLDARSDLFSLGCVLYEMLAGERPFLGANTMSILTSLAVHTPAAPHLVNPACPAALSRLVMQLLEKAPAARPASAETVIQALDELEAAPASSATTVPAAPAPRKAGIEAWKADTITLPTSTVPVPGPAPRRRLRFLAAVLLLGGLLAAGAGMLAVIHISTEHGDFVVETDDPDFSFKVSQGTVILEDARAKRAYHLRVVNQDKRKGQFDLEVTDEDAGLVFNTPTFTIKRGEQFALKASFQPKPANVAQGAPADPDRKAAAYVLSIGGTVRVNEQERDFMAAADLPREPFRLTYVDLRENKQVRDAGLAQFKDCKNLMLLILANTQVSDAGLAHFKECKNLTALGLNGTQVSDTGLVYFKDCKNLTHLGLDNTQVSDAGLAYFKDCKNLMWLALPFTKVSDAGLAHFKDCKDLTGLVLSGTKVSDAGLAPFMDCKNLTLLGLQKTKVTAAGIDGLKQALPQCRIEWDGGVIEPAASPESDRRAAEYVLSIGGTVRVNEQERDLMAAADLPREPFRLTHVDLRINKQVSDAGLAHFKDCKNLKYLDLVGTQVSDAGLAHLKECKNLTLLWLNGTQVSDAGLAHFKDCKNLTWLGLDGTQVSDAGLAHLKECKNLMALGLNDTQVSDTGLAHFKDCKNLTQLWLRSTPVSDAGLAHFKDCKNLTVIYLSYTQVSDAGLAPFRDCKNLTFLYLAGTKVSDAGLAHFKDCKNFRQIDLPGTQMSEAGLAHFKDCKDLTCLFLSGTNVSDAGLAPFKDCKNLTQLTLQKTKVTAAGIDGLKEALPQCRIEWDGGVIEPGTSSESDRRAAEYVLSIGGTVRVNELDRDFKAAADLPREPIRLTYVDLRGNKHVSDAGLAHFQDCKNLTVLWLSGTQVSDAGLTAFKNCKNLTLLFLDGTQVSDAGLACFKDCKNLTHLWLHYTQVSDAGLAHFKECKNLTHLVLDGTKVGDAGLAHFKECKNLTQLWLGGTQVSDAGLADFQDCRNLTQLYLGSTQVSDAGLAHFKDCKDLTSLVLSATKVSDEGLAHFKDCKDLTNLVLSGTKVSDAGLAPFRDCKNLTSLVLQKTNVTAAGIDGLKQALPLCRIEWDGGVIEPQ